MVRQRRGGGGRRGQGRDGRNVAASSMPHTQPDRVGGSTNSGYGL